MKRLLTIIGSPRENGISAKVLKLLEQKGIWVYKKNINPCIGCNYCKKHKECFIKDDMKKIYKKIEKMKVLLIITPIYFMGLPSPLKALIDRLQIYYNHSLKGEKKAFIFMIGEKKNPLLKKYYEKVWQYTLGNIGVTNVNLYVLENIKGEEDLKCYYNIIKTTKKNIEELV